MRHPSPAATATGTVAARNARTMAAGAAIRIQCAEHVVRARLQAWADALRLNTGVPVVLDVAVGEPVEVETGGAVFRQPGVAIHYGALGSTGGVCVQWESARAAATLEPGRTTARVTLSPAAVCRLDECASSFLSAVLILLLRRAGWHHLHGGIAQDPAGRGWLIAGDQGGGKSTTTALLATSGWRVGNDDIVFLNAGTAGRVTLAAARTPIALRDPVRARFAAQGRPLPARGKFVYWPEELGSRWIDRIEPDVIAFVSVGGERTTHATPITARQATARLIRSSAWVMLEPGLAQEHLDLLGRLARQVRSYRIRLAEDIFAAPERLQELIA